MSGILRLFLHNPARTWVHRNIAARAGRRGAFLAFLTVLDLLYGWSLYTATAAQRSLDLLLPWQAWGIIWTAVGVIIATGIMARQDIAQFTVAVLLKTAWGMTYLNLWLAHHLYRGWIAAVIWLAFAAIIVIIAGWPEPAAPEIITPDMPELPGLPSLRRGRR